MGKITTAHGLFQIEIFTFHITAESQVLEKVTSTKGRGISGSTLCLDTSITKHNLTVIPLKPYSFNFSFQCYTEGVLRGISFDFPRPVARQGAEGGWGGGGRQAKYF